ncbi:glycogen synthase [Fibrobacter sp.]|uniref:glycogen synthase n=1 Tax=Fibrobacter sp. TaxID=35828 RepID=UPI00388EAC5F
MEILVVCPEAGNWEKPSPLATAVNRMAEAFGRAGVSALTCSPFYKTHLIDTKSYQCIYRGKERLQGRDYEVWKSPNDPLHTYIYNEEYFGRPYAYGPPHDVPYGDNHLRFAFLASAVLSFAAATSKKVDAILGHEWGGALAGALTQTIYNKEFGNVPFFFTVHNINYDFHVGASEIEKIGLPPKDFNMDGYEFWGKVSILKAGIFYANKVLFPSMGYREAMLNTNLAGGLSGFLSHNRDKLIGVQFGVSYRIWDFNRQQRLPIKEAKHAAKLALAQKIKRDIANKLTLYVHLDEEAGNTSETLATILSDMAKLDMFIIVGIAPTHPEWNYYKDFSKQYPEVMYVQELEPEFESVTNLRDTMAGADVLFAANLREPSSSIILKAMATGTLPLTGIGVGVASLLDDYAPETAGCANAFLVEDANAPHQMLRRLKDVLEVYHEETADWDKAVVNAYGGFHYEWDRTISKYLLIFGELGL